MDFEKLDKAKWLVPILAVLVIIESVFIVGRLSNEKAEKWTANDDSLPTSLQPGKSQQTVLSLEGTKTVEKGEQGQLKVVMTPYKELSLDGVDILVEYDPEMVEILGTDPSDRFSRVGRNWVEADKKRVLVTLVQLDQTVDFEAGQEATLLTLSYIANQSGRTSFKLKKAEAGGTNLVGLGDEYEFEIKDLNLTIK